MDNAEGVRILLEDYNDIEERQYHRGDYDAIVILSDLHTAINKAGLTKRQAEVLRLVYVEDMSQTAAGMALGVKQTHVSRYLAVAEKKIARVYEAWARKEEGYSLSIENYTGWEKRKELTT